MVKVLLADDNELILLGLKTVIALQTDMQVVAEAHSRKELLKLTKTHTPDVILIDHSSPLFTIDSIPEVLNVVPATRFVAITQNHTSLSITNAIKSGITSYVKKDCDLNEIMDSIRETASGKKFFCGTILEMIKNESLDIKDNKESLTCAPVTLSERELEIIALIAEGYTNQQIAEKLFLSAHTVNTHRKNIMAKLGINNTAGIVMYAVKSHLVSPNKYLFSAQ